MNRRPPNRMPWGRRGFLLLIFTLARPPLLAQTAANTAGRVRSVEREAQPRADLGNGFYRNPVIHGDYADVAVVRVDRDYYLVNSGENPRGLLVWHSRDLVNWEPYARVEVPVEGDIWAPELDYQQGRFYLYLPIVATGTVWAMTATSMQGPWSKPVNMGLRGIDPGHITGTDGRQYLYVDAGRVAPLAADGLSAAGPLTKVYAGWQFPNDWPVQCFCLESPKLIHHGGYFYLVSAEGGTDGPSTSHMAVVARSSSPTGPWQNSPYNPLVHTTVRSKRWWSQGHGVLIDDADGSWWMLYHAIENGYRSLGRATLLLPIEWTGDGWPRVAGDANASEILRKPAGENVGDGMPLSDEFDAPTLGLQWNYGHIDDLAHSVRTGGGALRLTGGSPGMKDLSDAPEIFVSPVNHAYQATVEVEATATAQAGLALLSDAKGVTGAFLSQGQLTMFVQGRPQLKLPWSSTTAWFKVLDNEHDISVYASADGKQWRRFDFGIELDGVASVRVALAASGAGVFRHFTYQGLDQNPSGGS